MVWKHDCFNCCASLAKLTSVHGIANQISFISTLIHRNRDFRTDVERSVADELFQFKYGRFVKDIGDKWRWAHLFYNFVFQFLTFLCVFCASVQQVFEKTWKRKVLSRFCFLQGESPPPPNHLLPLFARKKRSSRERVLEPRIGLKMRWWWRGIKSAQTLAWDVMNVS